MSSVTDRTDYEEAGAGAYEPLYSWQPVIDLFLQHQDFVEFSGLQEGDLLVSRFCLSSLPIYPESWENGRNRWEGIRPEAMWHPLFWLPEELSGRYVDEEGYVEEDDLWALRVSIEMEARGLYSEESGWADMLKLNNLDIQDPAVVSRVDRWLAGEQDAALDNIQIPPARIVDGLEEFDDWSLLVAMEMGPRLHQINEYCDARDFRDILEKLVEDVSSVSGDGVDEFTLPVLANVSSFMAASFSTRPESESDWWHDFSAWVNEMADTEDPGSPNYGLSSTEVAEEILFDGRMERAIELLTSIENG